MSVLVVENLQVGYGKKKVGKPFQFSLEKGKLYTLIGKNGMGKSTLIKTLSRLVPPLTGNVYLDSNELSKISSDTFSKSISFVFTNQPIQKELSVYELISLGRQPHTNWMHQINEVDIEKIDEAIEITELTHLKNRKLHQLSDGQLQRALIARAITQDTPIILLDEPSSHLDLYHKVQLFKLLKNLCLKYNKCVLFSCHDLDLAIQLSDYMLVIKEDDNYFKTPNELINLGVFDHFFSDTDIVFSKEQKRFIIK